MRIQFVMTLAGLCLGPTATLAQSGPTAYVTPVSAPLTQSLRPMLRPDTIKPTLAASGKTEAQFAKWLESFRTTARANGISDNTLNAAFKGVRYDAKVVKRDRNQSEFTKTIWVYLDTAVSDARVKNGRAALAKHRSLLDKIERKYGVRKEIVVAIWGLESAYGSFRGSDSTIQSLATLAFDPRRSDFFTGQLLAALQILENGDVSAKNLKGSWAGAMGHTQFMPTSFHDHAVDFTGDGKRDIWSNDPSDALASTAAFLKHFGWDNRTPWGMEITLPKGFDYTLAAREITKTPAQWAKLGITRADGIPLKGKAKGSVLLPAGADGAAFLIFDNFDVIENYNTADAYVIAVGHLADRIAGGPAIKAEWPRQDRGLSYDERVEIQRRLTAKGFDTRKVDGKIGPLTINATRAYQVANDLKPDGYVSPRLLAHLRQ